MPGLIVDVRVEVGQKLQPGDGVMLLEAMKVQANAVRFRRPPVQCSAITGLVRADATYDPLLNNCVIGLCGFAACATECGP